MKRGRHPMGERRTISALWPYAIIAVLGILVHLPTFTGDFILDDKALIENNEYLKHPHSLRSYFMQEDGIVDKEETGQYHSAYYRPLLNLTYRLDYILWGMKAPGFRAVNLGLHLICCFLLFRLLVLLVHHRQAAFWATVLFALHPLNAECVSFIVSRNNLMVAIFSLLSFHYYIEAWEHPNRFHYALAVLFFAAAIFSKEFALMLLPVWVLYHRMVSEKRGVFLKEWAGYIPFVLVVVLYVILRKLVTNTWAAPSEAGDVLKRIYFVPYLIALNTKLVFFPHGLHSFITWYPTSHAHLKALGGIVFVLLAGIGLWKWKGRPVVPFSAACFVVALFPVLHIVQTSAVSLVSMRWLYFPMLFLSIAVAGVTATVLKRRRILAVGTLAGAVLYFGAYTYTLSAHLWHDEGTFFAQEVLHFENYFYAGGFARNLMEKKRYGEAERLFKTGLARYPGDVDTYLDYAALLTETGRAGEALEYLARAPARRFTPRQRGKWHNNRGTAFFQLGEYGRALEDYGKALELSPRDPDFRANLGATYGAMGNLEEAVRALEEGMRMAPDSFAVRKNLAVAYLRTGRPEEALALLKQLEREEGEDAAVTRLREEAARSVETRSPKRSGKDVP